MGILGGTNCFARFPIVNEKYLSIDFLSYLSGGKDLSYIKIMLPWTDSFKSQKIWRKFSLVFLMTEMNWEFYFENPNEILSFCLHSNTVVCKSALPNLHQIPLSNFYLTGKSYITDAKKYIEYLQTMVLLYRQISGNAVKSVDNLDYLDVLSANFF